MKRKYASGLLLLFVFVTTMILYHQYNTNKMEKIVEQLKKEYPAINVAEQVTGRVSNIYHPYPKLMREHPHQALIQLDDSLKRRLRTGYELTNSILLDDVLEIGDLLMKKAAGDRLHIHKVKN